MRTKNILIVMSALALGWLAASCTKQNDYDGFKETTDSRFGTVEEQREYLEGVLVIIGEEQVELDAYLEDLEKTSNVHAREVDSLIDDLDGRVAAVLDTLKNFARKDSMQVTFATLTVIDSLCGVTAAIEVRVKNDSITLTDSLKSKIAATHAAVTEKFKSYYTKDSLETLLKVQSDRMDTLSKNTDSARTEIAKLQKSIIALQEQHKTISAKLDNEIAILKGTDTNIENSIKTLDAAIVAEFASLEPKVTANTQAIVALEARVKKLELRVQSIEVVPDYADGSVDMAKKDSVGIRFEVRPRYLIDSLDGKTNLFSFQIIKTTAATKAGIFADTITVQSVTTSEDEDSLLIVKVDGTKMPPDFFDTTQTYSARLVFSDGNTDRTSAYFTLTVLDNLSANGTSNCYLVSKAGSYTFKAAVKGNCADSIISPAPSAVSVLWESYGTSTAPSVGDLVKNVTIADGYVNFTATTKKGNAVIAAKDGSGNILWSWHIWLTDEPAGQVYNNGAGTMMDRNLGATSACKEDNVGTCGLLYQWGRKDPFLGADSSRYNFSVNVKIAASTLEWPEAVTAEDNSAEYDKNLKFSIANPTTFIKCADYDPKSFDWYCWYSSYKNDNLWNVTAGKMIYDPCPPGWSVPEGGTGGVWAKAGFPTEHPYDFTHKGMDFASYTTSSVCWYPAVIPLDGTDYKLLHGAADAYYWSYSPSDSQVYTFNFGTGYGGIVDSFYPYHRSYGFPVRCVSE